METKILINRKIGEGIYQLVLEQDLQFQPGQFLTIRCGETICPRPFSILSSGPQGTEILYKVIGEGTKWLAKRRPSERVYVVGPLGNGFSLNQESKRLLFVAGGMGIVPILAFARSFLKVQPPPQMTLLYGAKNAGEHLAVYCQSPCFSRYWEPHLIAEKNPDIDAKYKGLVTDFLPEFLDRKPDQIFACGPRGMLAKMAEIIEPTNIPCQVALETYMGCGGQKRCFGCAIPRRSGGYFLLCKDGSVFDIREVALDGKA